MQQVMELARRYRERVPNEPVFPRVTVDELRAALGGALPESGTAASDVVAHLARGAEMGLVGSTGPCYFGFVIGGSLPVTTAADWLAAGLGYDVGLYCAWT